MLAIRTLRARSAGLLCTSLILFAGRAAAQLPTTSDPTAPQPSTIPATPPTAQAAPVDTPLEPAKAPATSEPADKPAKPAKIERSDGPFAPPEPDLDEKPEAATAAIGYTRDEGFRLRSLDGAYVLRIGATVGWKFEPTWTQGDHELGSTFAFLRPNLRGNFYKPWIGYLLSMELNQKTPFVLDAFVDLTPWDELGFVIGQQGTPVSRHDSFGPQRIFFPDYASVASYFWSGRERGLTVYGTVLDERLDYYAGLYGGSPLEEPTNLRDNGIAEGRLTVSPLGRANDSEHPFTRDGKTLPFRVSFTLQGYTGRLQTSIESANYANNPLSPTHSLLNRRNSTAGADLWLQGGPVIAFGEFYWSTERDDVTSRHSVYGAWGQVVANAYKNVIGVGARANWINPSTDLAGDDAVELEGQIAWFIHAPELVFKLRYAWLNQKSPDPATLGAFVLPFAVGTTNLVTAQLTLAL